LLLRLGQPLPPAAAAERGSPADIEEEFSRGEQAWKASCPKPADDGSCVELREDRYHRQRFFAIDRDRALVAESRRRFLTVARLWRQLGGGEIAGAQPSGHPTRTVHPAELWQRVDGSEISDAPPDAHPTGTPAAHPDYAPIFRPDPGMDPKEPTAAVAAAPAGRAAGAAHAAAGAAFYLAEAQWELFLHMKPPRDPFLSHYPPDADLILEQPKPAESRRMQRRMVAFITRRLDQLARVRQMYLALLARREAPFDVAAIARLGQLYQNFSEDVPRDELDDKAFAAYQRCFDTGAKTARYDEWFRLCERQLTFLRPTDFPPANELIPEASHAAGGMMPIPVIKECPGLQ
jgi:hypothetical protein